MFDNCRFLGRVRATRSHLELPTFTIHHCEKVGSCLPDATHRKRAGERIKVCAECRLYEPPGRPTCAHFGTVIRFDVNNLCGAKGQQAAIHKCNVHGECSVSRYCQLQKVKTCVLCDDYKSSDPLDNFPPLVGKPINRSRLKQHILYHIMPLKGQTEWVWRRHLAWIRQVRSKFNGRLILGIVTQGKRDHFEFFSPDVVKRECKGLGAEFLEAPNDVKPDPKHGLGEGVLFPRMLEALKTDDPDEVFYYGHCKGVTRPCPVDDPPNEWARAMFDLLFRNQNAVIESLDSHGVCGSMLMRGGFPIGLPGVGNKWFYSGTFYAMRLADIFNRGWNQLDNFYGCVETFPSANFKLDEETGCLLLNGVNNLYDGEHWKTTIGPAVDEWRAKHLIIEAHND